MGKIWTIIITMEHLQKFCELCHTNIYLLLLFIQFVVNYNDWIIHCGFLTLMIIVVYLKLSNSSLPFLSHHTLKIEGLHPSYRLSSLTVVFLCTKHLQNYGHGFTLSSWFLSCWLTFDDDVWYMDNEAPLVSGLAAVA